MYKTCKFLSLIVFVLTCSCWGMEKQNSDIYDAAEINKYLEIEAIIEDSDKKMGEDKKQLEDRFMDKVIKNQREKRESLKLQERLAARQLRASKVQDTQNNSYFKHLNWERIILAFVSLVFVYDLWRDYCKKKNKKENISE